MNSTNSDYPLIPEPPKDSLLDRFAHWLERATRGDHEADKSLIESEEPVLVESLVPARVTITLMGAFRL